MFDKDKTNKELREQVHHLRQRVAELEKAKADRGKAEEAIEQAQSDLSQIFNAAVPLCVINKDYIILRVNDTFCSLFGIKKDEFMGKICHKVWQGPFCNTPNCPMQQILSGREISEYELDKKLKHGRVVSCIITAVPHRGPRGEIIGIVENFTDITERKRMEEELHTYQAHLEDVVRERTIQLTAANEKLQQEITERKGAEDAVHLAYAELNQIFNAAADGMCVISKDLKVIRVNNTFCTLFGLTKDEVEGKSCYQAFHHSLCSVFACPLALIFNGEESYERDVEIDRSDGTKIYCILTATPFRGPDRELIGFVENFKDITEHKKAEEELQRVQKLESIGVLAGGIAHDFNNLLTAIIGNLSLLELYLRAQNNVSSGGMMGTDFKSVPIPAIPAIPIPVSRILTETEKASRQAKQLTSQLLTFSKGGLPVKKTASIAELVKNTADFALSGSKVKCDLSLPDDLWWAEIDEGQISQVINNLLMNAIQSMPEGGIISVSAQNVFNSRQRGMVSPQGRVKDAGHSSNDGLPMREGKYVKISIEDHGAGIQEKYLNQVFDPYFTTKQEGSGLGLSIAYSIIKSHGGYITVESHVGIGTVFQVYLPALEKESLVMEGVSEEGLRSGKGKILFMDDQQSIRDMVSEMLADLGYEVACAREGDEAVELYEQARESEEPFDAVILDLTIPGGMGGEEAIKKLHEIDPEIKAIVSSGYSQDPIMSEYRQYGFREVVAKPYGIKELSDVLHRVIGDHGAGVQG